MADFNPLTQLPDPKDFTGQNMGGTYTLPGFFQANEQRQQAAMPFIQMAQEAERQKIDQASKMNPLMLQNQRGTNTTQELSNNRFGQMTPHVIDEARLKNLGLGMANDKAGMENAVAGVELPQRIRDVQERDLNAARARFAAMAKDLQGKPGVTKVADYMSAAQGVASTISDPEHRRQFEEEFMKDPTKGMQALTARAAGIYNTPAAQQAKDVADIGAKASIEGHRISAGATIEAARIRERGAAALQQAALDNPKNAAVMVLKARSWLASPPANATPEQKAMAEGIVEGDDQTRAQKLFHDYQNSLTGIQDAAANKAKTYSDFLGMVKQNFKQVGAPRAGPTNEAARNLNVGDAALLDKYAPKR
jgi:hypothetical protein